MGTATVLVVEDDPTARRVVEAILSLDSYRLLSASGGEEALSIVGSTTTDLILCDVMMPGMNGFDMCRAIKSHTEWRLVPVMLLSSLGGVDDQVRGLEAGADDFISKPLVGSVLRARVRAMLRVRGQYSLLKQETADTDALMRARRDQMMARAGLSRREIQVLSLLLLGRAHDDIATALEISQRTSRFHQENILRKFGAESRFDLLRLFT